MRHKKNKISITNSLTIKRKLILSAVNRLQKFGFIHVNETNVSTDEVYSLYFLRILNEMLGENAETDIVINELLHTLALQNKNGTLKKTMDY